MRPSDVDRLPSSPSDPPGWHVRETTKDGYPLMGSSPAERQEAVERAVRIKRQAMRGHVFVGGGPYCEARISMGSSGSPEVGYVSGWVQCGYPPDTHPLSLEEPAPIIDRPAPYLVPTALGPPRPVRREVARPFTYRGDATSQAPRNWNECSNSVTGHSTGPDGRCRWCERRVSSPSAAPRLGGQRTRLEAEYRRHYDPDWGTGPGEV